MDDPDFESEASDTPQIIKVSQSSIKEMFLWMKFAFYLSRSSPLVMLRKLLISSFSFFPPSDLSLQNTFPVRDDLLSDLSDDDVQLAAKTAEVQKHTVISFKHKDDTDLFGLGIQEEPAAAKDSSEEQEGNNSIQKGSK